MAASYSKATQPIRMQGQQKCCHLLEKRAAHPVRMQDFQIQKIPHATEAMRMQDFQTQQKLHVTEVQHNADEALLV